jgi:hypothetical protein
MRLTVNLTTFCFQNNKTNIWTEEKCQFLCLEADFPVDLLLIELLFEIIVGCVLGVKIGVFLWIMWILIMTVIMTRKWCLSFRESFSQSGQLLFSSEENGLMSTFWHHANFFPYSQWAKTLKKVAFSFLKNIFFSISVD